MWIPHWITRVSRNIARDAEFVDSRMRMCQNGPMETKILFVYGTLMQGMRNHVYLEKAKFLGTAQTKPEYELLYNGSIPAARPGGHDSIKGELYEADEETLKGLDVLEEVDSNLYTKTEVEIDGKKATIYLGGNMFNFDTWEHVPDGDYRKLIGAAGGN